MLGIKNLPEVSTVEYAVGVGTAPSSSKSPCLPHCTMMNLQGAELSMCVFHGPGSF